MWHRMVQYTADHYSATHHRTLLQKYIGLHHIVFYHIKSSNIKFQYKIYNISNLAEHSTLQNDLEESLDSGPCPSPSIAPQRSGSCSIPGAKFKCHAQPPNVCGTASHFDSTSVQTTSIAHITQDLYRLVLGNIKCPKTDLTTL